MSWGACCIDPLSQILGQTLVLENRVGAGGMTGATLVARADPDGYTLLINSSAHSAIPAIYPNVVYDTARDFAAVTSLGSSPNVTVVSPEKGFKTLKDLVAAAKSRPGGLTFATAGVGSATHLSTERFRVAAGFEAIHVPFKGMPEALTEVMTGRVDFTCSSIAPAIPLIREGKVTALAVTTPKRSPALPDVPTSIEAGYANSDYTFWLGMFVPVEDPARDRRPPVSGGAEGPRYAGHGQAARAGRHRSDADHAAGVRRAGREGSRGEHRPGEGGRHQGAVTAPYGRL